MVFTYIRRIPFRTIATKGNKSTGELGISCFPLGNGLKMELCIQRNGLRLRRQKWLQRNGKIKASYISTLASMVAERNKFYRAHPAKTMQLTRRNKNRKRSAK